MRDARFVDDKVLLHIPQRAAVARCDPRRWLARVTAAADADTLSGIRRDHLGGPRSDRVDEHASLRAYLDRWRCEAGEFFGPDGVGP